MKYPHNNETIIYLREEKIRFIDNLTIAIITGEFNGIILAYFKLLVDFVTI